MANEPVSLADLGAFAPLAPLIVVPDHGTIVVAGAYEGRYLAYLSERFSTAKLFGYEPQREACRKALARFQGRPNIQIWNLGLSTREQMLTIRGAGTDGASLLRHDGASELAPCINAAEALSPHSSIDLLLLNMEGYEWALLPYLLDEMMHHRIKSLAIQFHPEYVSAPRTQRVLSYLDEYYDRVYFDYPAWTYWVRKTIPTNAALLPPPPFDPWNGRKPKVRR